MTTTPIDRTHCAARHHGNESAYRYGCRCPDAREDTRIKKKRRREGRHTPGRIPQLGTSRRLQALAAIGWPLPALAEHIGIRESYVRDLRLGRRAGTVQAGTAARVAATYDQLCGTPGPSLRAKRWAARYGWAPPLLWHDINIDDPTAVPDTDDPEPAGPRVRLDEVDHLTRSGLTLEQAAARLGVHIHSVAQARRRRARSQQSEAA